MFVSAVYLFCSVYFFFPVIHLLCISMLLFSLSLTTCKLELTIFIGGTITTIASLFIYKSIMFLKRYNSCGKTTFGLYGARLSLAVGLYIDISVAIFFLLIRGLHCTVYEN